ALDAGGLAGRGGIFVAAPVGEELREVLVEPGPQLVAERDVLGFVREVHYAKSIWPKPPTCLLGGSRCRAAVEAARLHSRSPIARRRRCRGGAGRSHPATARAPSPGRPSTGSRPAPYPRGDRARWGAWTRGSPAGCGRC